MRGEYGVQSAAFSKAIHVGRLSSDGRSFTDKADMTPEVVYAVAQYALAHFDGSMTFKVGGLVIDVDVRNDAEVDQ